MKVVQVLSSTGLSFCGCHFVKSLSGIFFVVVVLV